MTGWTDRDLDDLESSDEGRIIPQGSCVVTLALLSCLAVAITYTVILWR